MPHIIIEHSNNIRNQDAMIIGTAIQQFMGNLTEGNFDPDQCKIRSLSYDNFIVGLEKNPTDFIHISIKILVGRTTEIRNKLARLSFDFAKEFVTRLSLQSKRCDISVDISEMDREVYHKITLES